MTTMHSSRMRTARLLTVSHSFPCISGRCLPNCPPTQWRQSPLVADPPRMQAPLEADPLEAVSPGGRHLPHWMQTPLAMWPVMHAGKPTPTPLWTERMTNTCEKITLPQTLFAVPRIHFSQMPTTRLLTVHPA